MTSQAGNARNVVEATTGFSYEEIREAARERWLTTREIEFLLSMEYSPLLISRQPPTEAPVSGSLFLYDRNITKSYKSDSYTWTKKRNSRRVREDHVKLRIQGQCRVAGNYSHCVDIPTLHRRVYKKLNPETGDTEFPFTSGGPQEGEKLACSLILVHYFDENDVPKKEKRTQTKQKSRAKKARIDSTQHSNSEENGSGQDSKRSNEGTVSTDDETKATVSSESFPDHENQFDSFENELKQLTCKNCMCPCKSLDYMGMDENVHDIECIPKPKVWYIMRV